jgi:hypothetical protein
LKACTCALQALRARRGNGRTGWWWLVGGGGELFCTLGVRCEASRVCYCYVTTLVGMWCVCGVRVSGDPLCPQVPAPRACARRVG